METTELAKDYTIAKYRQLKVDEEKELIASLIYQRFYERYIKPFEDNSNRHGFSMMAVSCLMIEALQSFKEGKEDTRKISKQTFDNFFNNSNYFTEFLATNFYDDIRCGILHQAETRGGWRIWQVGKLLDNPNKIINALCFLKTLEKELESYRDELKTQPFDSEIWNYAILKLDYICTISCQK
jgi:hypothetical protein